MNDILHAIERTNFHLRNTADFKTFEEDLTVHDAVKSTMQIIGEATSKIFVNAPEFVTQHPELPWEVMRKMRNTIVHDYAQLDLENIWETAKNDLPGLKQQVEPIVKSLPPEPSWDELKAQAEASQPGRDTPGDDGDRGR